MKRTALNVILSILLIIAGLLAQAGGAWGVIECAGLSQLDDKLLETVDKTAELEDAIGKLKDTEDEYYKGIDTLYTGQLKLSQGQGVVSQGKQVLADGKAKVAEAQKQYDKAKAKLDKSKQVIADAEQKMAETRDDYEKGKETLATAEEVMPLLSTYLKIRDGISIIPGIKSTQQWYESKVIPAGAERGLDLPPNVEDFEPYLNNYIAEGKQLLATYEEAEVQLAEGRKQIAVAEEQLAEAKAVLDNGKNALKAGQSEIDEANGKLSYAASVIAEGKKTLKEYDEGVGALGEGLAEFLKLEAVKDRSGSVVVKSMQDRLGKDFDVYLHNDDGEVLALSNGDARLDYDKCLEVCKAYREYVDDYIEDVNSEIKVRFVLDAATILAGLFAVIAGALALRGKKSAKKFSFFVLMFVLACNVYGMLIGYTGFTYPPEEDLYAGLLTAFTILMLLLFALAFRLVVKRAELLPEPDAEYEEREAPETTNSVQSEYELEKERRKEMIREIVGDEFEEASIPEPEAEEAPVVEAPPVVEEPKKEKRQKKNRKKNEEPEAPTEEELAEVRRQAIAQFNEALEKYNRAKEEARKREN